MNAANTNPGIQPAGTAMSRIIAGAAGGTTLVSVPGSLTRPTTDRVKEALFSRLDAFEVIAGRPGAGSLRRFRFARRGKRQPRRAEPWTWWNPTARPARSASATRTSSTRSPGARWSPCTAPRSSRSWTGPRRPSAGTSSSSIRPTPSTSRRWPAVLAKLLPHLAEGAVVVVERSSRTPEPSWPDGMERFAERKYGETKLWFAEPGAEEGPGRTMPAGNPDGVS